MFAPSPVGEGWGEGTRPLGLTQAQLENQRFSFTRKNKIDVQLHATFHFGKGRLDFARIGFDFTRTLTQRGQGFFRFGTVSSALHLLIAQFPLYSRNARDKHDADILRPAAGSLQPLMTQNRISEQYHTKK